MNASTVAEQPLAAQAPPTAIDKARLARARVQGAAIVYRLYDVGYEIDLERVVGLLTSSAPERIRPVLGEAEAIDIPNPPITVNLAVERLAIGDWQADAEVSARIFDFGVVSLRLRVAAPPGISWRAFSAFGNHIDVAADVGPLFHEALKRLLARIGPGSAVRALPQSRKTTPCFGSPR